jgi:hypothetical protein
MSSSRSFLKASRLVHLYLGVFTTPALLFFAFTGAVQTFSLHETTKGSDYKPARILVILGQIHKKQTPVIAAPKAPPVATKPSKADKPEDSVVAAQAAPKPAAPAPEVKRHNALPLKIFFLVVAISLFTSTLTGIYMAYKFARNKLAVTGLLVLGTVIPVLMILL